MAYGISVYTTEDFSVDKNKEYIKTAKEKGYSLIFTSMNILETDYEKKLAEIKELFLYIRDNNMKLSVDISPKVMKLLNASHKDLSSFNNLGISCLRLDYGFNADEIALMSNNDYGIDIELNASTISSSKIEELINAGANIKRLRTCHNFYPKPYTGLSYNFFKEKTLMIKGYGLRVGAFIPSKSGKRGPIYEGLPTLEKHRYVEPYLAARELLYSKIIDDVYFGDAYASLEELERVSSIDKDVIDLEIELESNLSDYEKTIIFSGSHTNRPDASEYIIRSEESRNYGTIGRKIDASRNIERRKYCVTIDNNSFGRYAGELMICLADLPKDNRVNVIGYINEDSILLKYINPSSKFRFIEK